MKGKREAESAAHVVFNDENPKAFKVFGEILTEQDANPWAMI